MSADKDRAIRRAKQKRAKQLKKAARREAPAGVATKAPEGSPARAEAKTG